MAAVRRKDERDEDLIARYYQCEEEAMEVLFRRYYGLLVAIVRTAGIPETHAEEVAREVPDCVMLTKIGARTPFDPARGRARPWLMAIARNEIVSWFRKNGGTKIPLELDDPAGDGSVLLVDKSPSVLDHLLKAERWKIVQQCLKQLPAADQRIVRTRLEMDLSYEDIAALVGKKVGTVRVAYCRARRKLEDCVRARVNRRDAR